MLLMLLMLLMLFVKWLCGGACRMRLFRMCLLYILLYICLVWSILSVYCRVVYVY